MRHGEESKIEAALGLSFPRELQEPLLPDGDYEGHEVDNGSTRESRESLSDEDLLCLYAAQGLISEMRKLIEQGVAVDCFDIDGNSPLHCACSSGSDAAVGLLLSQGAQVDIHGRKGLTPLHSACIKNSAACCTSLLRHGATIHCISEDGKTALHYAAQSGSEECITQLLLHCKKADVNASDMEGRTPLHFACVDGNEHVMRRLLQAGGDVNMQDHQHRSVLDIAEGMNHSESFMHLLASYAGDSEFSQRHRLNPSQLATRNSAHSSGRHETIQNGRFVLVDEEGYMLEDPSSHHVLVYHMKSNILSDAKELEDEHSIQGWHIAQIEANKWEAFCREVEYKWKDDDEEEDPMLAQYKREQLHLQMMREQNGYDDQELDALTEQIVDLTREVDSLTVYCNRAQEELLRIGSENDQLQVRLDKATAPLHVPQQQEQEQQHQPTNANLFENLNVYD